MKILSIDVGIKNLAFCLFEYSDTLYNVIAWDVIDICDSESKKICQINKCKKIAKYEKNGDCFCKTHAKQGTFRIPNKQSNIKYIKKMKIKEVQEYCKTEDIDVSTCKLKQQYINEIEQFINDKFYDTIQDKNANNMTLIELGKNMVSRFDAIFNEHTIDNVLIENQISPIANRMKTIQGMIAQYFIMRDVNNVEFISASNKLKGLVEGKTTYKERKKLSIDIVRKQFETNNKLCKWTDVFNTHKKKDDLADSFLQGLWYLNNEIKK